MKKIISVILCLVMLISVFGSSYVVNAEEILKCGSYYVGDTSFAYYISDHNIVGDMATEFLYDTTLYITGFSGDFSRKVTVPDEIEGIKIESVVLVEYECIETLVLSDGIKSFACYDEQGDRDHMNERDTEPNSIKYLYLGKDFSENGMFFSQVYSSIYGTRLKQLEKIYVSEENPNLTAVNGILYSKDLKRVIMMPEKNPYTFYRSDVYLSSKTTEIGKRAYKYTKGYKNLDIKRITYIGNNAFYGSSLRNVTIYGKTTYIGIGAFLNCKKLKKVTIKGNTKKEIAYNAFDCKKIIIDSKIIPKIYRRAFSDGTKFYVKSKKIAKKLKTALKKAKIKKYKIYVGKKLYK